MLMERFKKGVNVFLFLFITVLIIGLTFFFLEQSIIAEKTPGYYFDPLALSIQVFTAVIIITLISLFATYFIDKIWISRSRLVVIILLVALFFIVAINILVMPEVRQLSVSFLDGTIHQVLLTLPLRRRITAILTLFINIAFLFFIILILPNHKNFSAVLKALVIVIVVIGLFAIGYSLRAEWDTYVAIFGNGYSPSQAVPASFFNNRNPYASFLLNAQVLAAFLYFANQKKWYRFLFLMLQIPFVLAILFTFSKTNVLISIALLLAIYYFHLVRLLIRKRFILFTIEIILSTQFILLVSLFRFVPALAGNTLSDFLLKYLPDEVFAAGSRTMEARFELWRYAWTLIKASPLTLFIGDGPHLSRYFYFDRMSQEINGISAVGFGDYHNGFIEVLHTFGFVGFALYLVIIFGSIIVVLKRVKTNKPLAFYLALALVIFLARSQTESLAMLLFKSEGIIASFTYVLPLLYFMKLSHEKGYSKLIEKKTSV